MLKKIEKKVSLFSENIFIRYYIVREKIKNFSAPLVNSENKERGIAHIAVVGVVALVTAIGGAIWGYAKVKTDLGDAKVGFFASLLVSLGFGLILIASSLFNYAANFLAYVLDSTFVSRAITTDQTFVDVWIQVRNLANMLIVLGFVVIGVATSLRIREYEAKKLLGSLILVALLINFSGLFCGLIIDASNITMNTFLGGDKASQNFLNISAVVQEHAKRMITGHTDPNDEEIPLKFEGAGSAAPSN